MGKTWTPTDFERYILGNMPDEEVQRLEGQMHEDPGLKEEYELYSDTRDILQELYSQKVLTDIHAIDRDMRSTATATHMRLWRNIAAAAAVLVLLTAGIWIWSDQYYDRTRVAQRFSGPTIEDNWRSGEGQDKTSLAALLSEADALFTEGAYEQAAQLYKMASVAETTRSEYASWQLVLCLMATNDESKEFKDALERIAGNPDHLYHEDAVKLMRTMRNFFFN